LAARHTSVTRALRSTPIEDESSATSASTTNGDLVEAPVTIYRVARKGPTVDRVVTVRATGGA
jgi:hypothetical protein